MYSAWPAKKKKAQWRRHAITRDQAEHEGKNVTRSLITCQEKSMVGYRDFLARGPGPIQQTLKKWVASIEIFPLWYWLLSTVIYQFSFASLPFSLLARTLTCMLFSSHHARRWMIGDDEAPGRGEGDWCFSSLLGAKRFHISDTPVSTRRASPIVVREADLGIVFLFLGAIYRSIKS